MAQRTGQKREYTSSYPTEQIIRWWHEFAADDLAERARIGEKLDPDNIKKKEDERAKALRMWGKDK